MGNTPEIDRHLDRTPIMPTLPADSVPVSGSIEPALTPCVIWSYRCTRLSTRIRGPGSVRPFRWPAPGRAYYRPYDGPELAISLRHALSDSRIGSPPWKLLPSGGPVLQVLPNRSGRRSVGHLPSTFLPAPSCDSSCTVPRLPCQALRTRGFVPQIAGGVGREAGALPPARIAWTDRYVRYYER